MVIAIDDNDTMALMRLFNEPEGRRYLVEEVGVPVELVEHLDLLGISSIANVLMAIKFSKYYELGRRDIVVTVFTDSMEMYQSRLREGQVQDGEYDRDDAIRDFHLHLRGLKLDAMQELTFYDRKRIHHLKYFTWIEQQQFPLDELNRQWYEYDEYWPSIQGIVPEIDRLIEQFNEQVGLI